MRNLASIQTNTKLETIPGKDRILYASFENVGFRVIVGNDMKVGQKVLYVEADSVLPEKPAFEFLRARCYSDKWNGFRIRNMKLANLYSEGIVFPLETIKEVNPKVKIENLKDGDDVTDQLGIIKYDPEWLEEQKNAKKPTTFMNFIYKYKYLRLMYFFIKKMFTKRTGYAWPSWAQKSDETRIQVLPYSYEKYAGMLFSSTEKLDGSSCLMAIHKKKFIVCSRNINLKDPGKQSNQFWGFAKKHDVESKLKQASKDLKIDLYVQGELVGSKIQQNKYKIEGHRYFVFNVKDITNNRYFNVDEITRFCENYGFERVPVLEKFIFNFKNIDELLKYADGYSVINPKTLREGVVIRPVVQMPPDRGQSNMCSFKVISPSFDIAYKGD